MISPVISQLYTHVGIRALKGLRGANGSMETSGDVARQS